jgi:hypothetical protein
MQAASRKQGVSGAFAVNGLKKTAFFGHTLRSVYLRLTVCALSSETASFEYGV